MKDYTHYTAEDFIRDERFRDWVQGRRQEEAFWPAFLQKYPDKKGEMQQAELVVRAAGPSKEDITEKEIREEIKKFLSRIKVNAGVPAPPTFSYDKTEVRSKHWSIVKYAAVAVVLIALGVLPFIAEDSPILQNIITTPKHPVSSLVETSNPTAEPLRLRLGDESVVVLSPHSRLSYPTQFADSARIVYLTGEASFSVERQVRPFLVVTGDMVTKVLGTQFVVRAFAADQKYSVQVISGKVSVSRTEANRTSGNRENNGLILTANQAAIFEKDLRHLTKTLVADPLVIQGNTSATDEESRYDETPLPKILTELEVRYGIPIQFDESSLENCRITATLTNETLYEKLDILCKTVSATYEIVDGQIVVSGRGCR